MARVDFNFELFARLLTEDMAAAGIRTQRQLAAAAGCDETRVSKWLNGRDVPTDRELDEVLQLFRKRLGDRFTSEREREYGGCRGRARRDLTAAESRSAPPLEVRASSAGRSWLPARGAITGALWGGGLVAVVATAVFLLGRDPRRFDGPLYIDDVTISGQSAYGFEDGAAGWGEHVDPGGNRADLGVAVSCGKSGVARSGNCSLEFRPTSRGTADVFVSVTRDPGESVVEAWVHVTETLCNSSGCSTARMIAWDQDWKSHEGDYVELRPGWRLISLDLRGRGARSPLRELGIHAYLVPR